VPPLLLQPLAENAVRHGIATLVEGGDITIAVRRSPDCGHCCDTGSTSSCRVSAA
jgi:sensor histidine kinase YesM